MKIKKTNAMRMLDQHKITYTPHPFEENDESAVFTANLIGADPNQVFKTLVLQNTNKEYFACCVPSLEHLSEKKLAKLSHSKKVEMVPQKLLLGLTGYVHGGCSPIGMKKQFPTFIHETALNFETIYVSSGQRGMMIELNPQDIFEMTQASFADIIL